MFTAVLRAEGGGASEYIEARAELVPSLMSAYAAAGNTPGGAPGTGGAAALQPCFVFDAAEVRAGGPRRAAFVREAVCALRGALAERESSLAVREGRPEDVLAALCEATGATAVYAAAGTSYEALELEARVRR